MVLTPRSGQTSSRVLKNVRTYFWGLPNTSGARVGKRALEAGSWRPTARPP